MTDGPLGCWLAHEPFEPFDEVDLLGYQALILFR
jgi:hypothetical protein